MTASLSLADAMIGGLYADLEIVFNQIPLI